MRLALHGPTADPPLEDISTLHSFAVKAAQLIEAAEARPDHQWVWPVRLLRHGWDLDGLWTPFVCPERAVRLFQDTRPSGCQTTWAEQRVPVLCPGSKLRAKTRHPHPITHQIELHVWIPAPDIVGDIIRAQPHHLHEPSIARLLSATGRTSLKPTLELQWDIMLFAVADGCSKYSSMTGSIAAARLLKDMARLTPTFRPKGATALIQGQPGSGAWVKGFARALQNKGYRVYGLDAAQLPDTAALRNAKEDGILVSNSEMMAPWRGQASFCCMHLDQVVVRGSMLDALDTRPVCACLSIALHLILSACIVLLLVQYIFLSYLYCFSYLLPFFCCD